MSESSQASIFSQIAKKEIPAKFYYEDEEIMVIKDVNPMAPVHVLVIPKQQFATLEDIPLESDLPAKLLTVARKVAQQLGIEKDYRLVMNVGRRIQQVPHVHLHLMGGWSHPETEA